MSYWEDYNMDFEPSWFTHDWVCEAQDDLLDQAIAGGLWLDREGILYEMHELTDQHIVNILRFVDKMPDNYMPLINYVRAEKERRDSKRRNKFFGEVQVI